MTENFQDIFTWYYAPLALRTANPDAPLEYFKMGFLGELGELLNLYKKERWHGKPVGVHEYIDELGDVFWYGIVFLSKLNEKNESDDFNSAIRLVSRWCDHFTYPMDFKVAMEHLTNEMWEHCADSYEFNNDAEYVARILTELVAVCYSLHWNVRDVLEKNVEKLSKRFPEGFTSYSQRGDVS